MSFYGYRSTEMLKGISKCADGWATVNTPTLQPPSSLETAEIVIERQIQLTIIREKIMEYVL